MEIPSTSLLNESVNVGNRLSSMAAQVPDQIAVAVPIGSRQQQPRRYRTMTFRELDIDSNRLAHGMLATGIPPGSRLVLMVPPGLDFFSLVFAIYKARMVLVLIDPGMSRASLVGCLQEVMPDGFAAIPPVQAVRCLLRTKFPRATHNITVGKRWFWGGQTLAGLRAMGRPEPLPDTTQPGDPAAIIFTTGSTGPPKGVLYSHQNFSSQLEQLQQVYSIQVGEIDLPGFPLFALFNAALGVTTVVPDMDFTRPANVDPRLFVDAANQWSISQAFGSPALWNTVGRYCDRSGAKMPTLRRALSAGAPVPPHVLANVRAAIHEQGDVHTPYGATEALPVATITASEVLGTTASISRAGGGTCVGRRFPQLDWRVIAIDDGPIESIEMAPALPNGQIGELIVRGPVVTARYVTREDANRLHKIRDGSGFWHRMGDLGYLDDEERFWFCGRKSHRVQTEFGVLYTIPCEAIFNQHPHVYRSALVGVGKAPQQQPVLVVETWPEHRPRDELARSQLIRELRECGAGNALTREITDIRIHKALPVDIRHNSKIFREQLAIWASKDVAALEMTANPR